MNAGESAGDQLLATLLVPSTATVRAAIGLVAEATRVPRQALTPFQHLSVLQGHASLRSLSQTRSAQQTTGLTWAGWWVSEVDCPIGMCHTEALLPGKRVELLHHDARLPEDAVPDFLLRSTTAWTVQKVQLSVIVVPLKCAHCQAPLPVITAPKKFAMLEPVYVGNPQAFLGPMRNVRPARPLIENIRNIQQSILLALQEHEAGDDQMARLYLYLFPHKADHLGLRHDPQAAATCSPECMCAFYADSPPMRIYWACALSKPVPNMKAEDWGKFPWPYWQPNAERTNRLEHRVPGLELDRPGRAHLARGVAF